jgi:acyl-coenzyme A thioesterase PaaI-like protein
VSLPSDPRRVYITDDPAEDTPRARKHELVRQTKRVIEHVALLDVHNVDDPELVDLIGRARDLAEALERQPRFQGLADLPSPDSALLERSGISGRSNPLAPPLQMTMDDDGITHGEATYGMAYEGPVGCLHGGFVAAAFDELLGFAQTASGIAGYTGTLTIRMRRPTPLKERIRYEARVDRAEGRKIFCTATSWHDDTLLCEAEIVMITPRDGATPR